MTYEYECQNGHRFEHFFKSFTEAEPFINEITCPFCMYHIEHGLQRVPASPTIPKAQRVVSKPLLPHLYGDPAGYDHPSPTKRHSTRLVSVKGNDSAIG